MLYALWVWLNLHKTIRVSMFTVNYQDILHHQQVDDDATKIRSNHSFVSVMQENEYLWLRLVSKLYGAILTCCCLMWLCWWNIVFLRLKSVLRLGKEASVFRDGWLRSDNRLIGVNKRGTSRTCPSWLSNTLLPWRLLLVFCHRLSFLSLFA